MTGKELILKALRNEETPRPAWLPFVGCHGGKLIGKTASEYLQSSDLLVEGLEESVKRYRPDGLPIMFDLQVEAEILGCDLHWADEVPPAVVSHPLVEQAIEDLPEFDIAKGRFPIVLDALDRMVVAHDDIAFYGLICGPFTLALHLLGNDIFLKMYDDPDGVKRVLDYAADIAVKSASAYIDHGASVIGVVDPMTSQISAEHFAQFVTPAVNKVFDAVRDRGALSSMFVCGDATRNLEEMCRTTADNISVDEQISMTDLKNLCAKWDKSFGGNIKLTAVLLLGSADDSAADAADIIEVSGNKGFVLAPGCDLPYNTPPENLEAVTEAVHDPYRRNVAKAAVQANVADTFDDITPPDYPQYKEVIIDVITLDSTSCAPCQYMMEAVVKAAEKAFVKVFINEHKIKARQGLGMMAKLGVKNLPTICIDGEIVFSSIIPDIKTLVKAIDSRAVKKNIDRLLT
jgi:MtaA/CmuA family methyltransferase